MPESPTGAVLHYVGYDVDRGGILATIRALAAEKRFPCVLGVNPGFRPLRSSELALLRLPGIAGDTIGARSAMRARRVARAVQGWLHEDPSRVFHGHSRAGLLVALWLSAFGELRVVSTVHCYGRQRWFYRWAARRLAGRIFWLSPAMKRHYGCGFAEEGWRDCLPPCVASGDHLAGARAPESDGFHRSYGSYGSRGSREPGAVRFGCVGALVPVKQWELVPQALAKAPRTIPLRVVLAGSDDGTAQGRRYAGRLRTLAAAPEVAGRFELRGEVENMAAFYREIDCLIIASRWEAFSVAALEGGQAGVPCLAADAGGNHDLVKTARLGWLFEAGSAGDCAAKLMELARGDMLKNWRRDETALRRFTAPVVATQHVDVYRQLGEGRSRQR